jgi:dienelactone hydrolase
LTLELGAADKVRKHKLRPRVFAHRASYFVITALLSLVLAAVPAFRLFRAASFLYAMSPPPQRLRVIRALEVLQHEPMTTDFWIQGRRGPLDIRMVTPKDLPHAPIVVLAHGFAPTGVKDAWLNLLAKGLCRSGLRVVMPNIKSEEMLRIDPAAVDDVDDAIRWSAMNSRQKVSVFGISFSGGMVIAAVANPDYVNYVKMTFCVSGYNSIDRLGRFYLHDAVRRPDGQPYAVMPPTYALAAMALQYMDELVSPDNTGPLSEILRRITEEAQTTELPSTNWLTAKQRVLLDDVLNVRTPAMRLRYYAVLERHRAELAYISPMGKINQVHGSLYVLHGDEDRTIPCGEAEWTRTEAADKENARVMITPWMFHAVLNPRAPFGEKLRVVYFVSEMLDEALRPVPLASANG